MKKLSEYMQDMKELLKDEKRWTKGTFARDKKGQPVAVTKKDFEEATGFCLVGAAAKVTMADLPPYQNSALSASLPASRIASALAKVLGQSAWGWNDASARTHDDVMRLLDRAIDHQVKEEAGVST